MINADSLTLNDDSSASVQSETVSQLYTHANIIAHKFFDREKNTTCQKVSRKQTRSLIFFCLHASSFNVVSRQHKDDPILEVERMHSVVFHHFLDLVEEMSCRVSWSAPSTRTRLVRR